MPLKYQLVSVPIGSMGMDSDKDPKTVQGVLRAVNADYDDTDGAIAKREGDYSPTRVLDSYSQGEHLAVHKDGVLVFGRDMHLYAPGSSPPVLTQISSYGGLMDVGRDEVLTKDRNIAAWADIAFLSRIHAVVYTTANVAAGEDDGYNVFVETFDNASGVRQDRVQLYSGTNKNRAQIRVINPEDPDAFAWIYLIEDDGTVRYSYVQNDGVVGGPFDLTGAPTAKARGHLGWDSCILEGAGGADAYAMLAYPDSSGTCALVAVQAGSTVAHTATYSPGIGDIFMAACWRQTNTTWCISVAGRNGSTDTVRTVAYSLTLSALASDVGQSIVTNSIYEFRNITGVAMDTQLARTYITRTENDGYRRPHIIRSEYDYSGAATASVFEQFWIVNAQSSHKPAVVGDGYGRHVFGAFLRSWGGGRTTAQDQLWWVSEDGYAVGRSLVGTARMDSYGIDSYGVLSHLCPDQSADGYTFHAAWPYLKRLSVDDTQQSDQLRVARFVLDNEPSSPQSCFADDQAWIANSMGYETDGSRLVEAGFPVYPETFRASPGAAIGAMDPGDTHKYVAVYEEIDGNGRLHRSAPTPTPVSVTLKQASNGVYLVLPTFPGRRENGVVAVYRTTDGGTEYYRALSMPNSHRSTLAEVQVVDGLADSDLTDNEALYTDSGELENIPPLPHRISAVWQRRHFYVDRDHEDSRIYYSKEFSPGLGVGFSDILAFECDSEGGRITALFPLGNKLIIFKGSRIYATAGNGLNALGQGTNFSPPWLVSPSIGCPDHRTLVRTPDGVMFQSERGIWILTQNEQLVPAGEAVSKYANDLSFVGGGVIESRNEAWLLGPHDGYSVSYNWMENKWAIHTRRATAAVSRNGKLFWLDGYGNLVENQPNNWSDDTGGFYSLRIDTGWFSFAKIAGYKRIRRILLVGQNLEQHKLRVRVAYDFDPNWTDIGTYDATALTEFNLGAYYEGSFGSAYDDQAYIVEVPTSRQKCTSIRISVEDTESSGPSRGYSLTQIAFEVGIKPRAKPQGDGRVA